MKRVWWFSALALVGVASAAGLATAGQSSSEGTERPAEGARASALADFRLVETELSVPAGSQVSGRSMCFPSGTVVWGGGVAIDGDMEGRVNSSYPLPTGRGWQVYVSNLSTHSMVFWVYAVCAQQPAGYKIVAKAGYLAPAGWGSSGIAVCPAGSVALSGGGLSSSRDLNISLNSTQPTLGETRGGLAGWQTALTNQSAAVGNAKLTVYAVCAKPPAGYEPRFGSSTNGAGQRDIASVSCVPAGKVVVGVGAYSSEKFWTTINTLVPNIGGGGGGGEGLVAVNNGGTRPADLLTVAICVS